MHVSDLVHGFFVSGSSTPQCLFGSNSRSESLLYDLLLLLVPFWYFLAKDGEDKIPLPFKIFSGDGDMDLEVVDTKQGLTKVAEAGLVDEDTVEVVVVVMVVVVEFILILASDFTRLGIFSRLTTGTETHGLSRGTFGGKATCCGLLFELCRLSLDGLNGLGLLVVNVWLMHVFDFIWTNGGRELEGEEAGESDGLHKDPCLLSQCDWKTCGLITWLQELHTTT